MPRKARALYDYDAADEDEISIREGDVIEVLCLCASVRPTSLLADFGCCPVDPPCR